MTKHTPAPWSYSTGSLQGSNGLPVAQQRHNVSLFEELERINADKALICAAPALLAALKGLYELGAPEGLALTAEEMRTRYDAARQAITSATFRS